MVSQKLRFKMIGSAFPEQYDVFLGDQRVAYLRLRHGRLRVDCPDVGGETVYETTQLEGSGFFDTQEERDYHLRHAGAKILEWVANGPKSLPVDREPAPNIEYELEDFTPFDGVDFP